MTVVVETLFGAQPTARDYDRTVHGPYAVKGIRTFRVADTWLEPARAQLLADLPRKGAQPYDLDRHGFPRPLWHLGEFVAVVFGVQHPRAAYAHRDVPLPYHRDTQMPYPCLNATVIFAHGGIGAVLAFPDERVGIATVDGLAALFDGQRLHGLTDFILQDGGWRISVTYYCPVDVTRLP